MNIIIVSLSILSFIVGCFMILLAFYTWKKHWKERNIEASRTTTILMICTAIWLYGFIFQLNLPSVESKKYFEYFLYIGPIVIAPTWLVLAIQWTGRNKILTRSITAFIYSIPLLFYTLILTNDYHRLIFKELRVVQQNSIFVIDPLETEIWWIFAFYLYTIILTGVVLLVTSLFTYKYIYKKHIIILLTGTIVPLVVNALYNLYIVNLIHFDFTPISFLVTGIVYYWGFSRFKLIEIIPVARDAIFDNMRDLVFVLDSEYRLVDANPTFLKTFNLKGVETIGKKIYDLLCEHNELVELITSGKFDKNEVSVRFGDERRFYDLQINCLKNRKDIEIGRSISMRDITSRKKIEDELKIFNIDLELKVKERTAEVEMLLKQKEDFIWQLSHDLKSPLTPILGLLPTVIDEERDPKIKELLYVIERNANYMKDLVTKTLELERIGSIELNIENVDILSLVNDILENKKILFSEKELEVENNLSGKLILNADKVQLNELIDNLLTNAVKYTPNKGKIMINGRDEGDFILLSISDTGLGLEKNQTEKIFDEFYKIDQSRHDLDSSGLGLSICKKIVERHKGNIWAESPGKGKGSTFYIRLPKNQKEIKTTLH